MRSPEPGPVSEASSNEGAWPEPLATGETAPGTWIELSVAADVEAVEAVSEILTRYAPGGTSVEPGFRLREEGLAAELDASRPSIVRAYLPALDPAAVRTAVAAAREALGHLQAFGLRPIGELATRLVREEDWAEAWKSHFPVLRVGRRLVIRPTWRRHRRRDGDVVLALDPGMAFGTGLHPTTRLCLAGLEAWADEGLLAGTLRRAEALPAGTVRQAEGLPAGALRQAEGLPAGALRRGASRAAAHETVRVLDVGCGSGILAIAAAKLGAGEVLGVDPDPIAVEASTANARRNAVARRVRVRPGSVPTGEPAFDLVLANLIASLLVELAAPLHAEVRPGGRLLASGIFRDREDDVRSAFEQAGFRLGRRWAEDDWVALEATGASPD